MNNSNSRKKAVAAMAMLAALTGKSLRESIEEILEEAEDYNSLKIETNKEGLNEMHIEAYKISKFLIYISALNLKKDTKLVIKINELLAEANIAKIYNAEELYNDIEVIQNFTDQITNAYGDFTIKDKIAAEMLIDENATEYSLNIAKEIIFNIDSQIKTFKENVENLAKEVALYKLM